MRNRNGFTLIEVIIGCGILSLFICGILSLYSSGSKMGNSTMWLQTTSNQLKNAARQINTSIRKSAYPSFLKFPKTIKELQEDTFKLHYYGAKLEAKKAGSVSSALYGTKFLGVTESTPGKSGYGTSEDRDAKIIYHIFSLADNGDLTYSRYQMQITNSEFSSLNPENPPSGASGVYKTTLVKNVESVTCSKTDETSTEKRLPIQVEITCTMPNSKTSRSEKAVGTPNVDVLAHTSTGGW